MALAKQCCFYLWGTGPSSGSRILIYTLLSFLVVTTRLFLLVCICVLVFFQLISSSKSWKGSSIFSSMNASQVLDVVLKSRADATAKSYMRVIKKFLDWCKSRQISFELPFPLGVVSLYLFEVRQSCTSSSSVILAHTALKWLHSFVPTADCSCLLYTSPSPRDQRGSRMPSSA